jgi:hypothetical protein
MEDIGPWLSALGLEHYMEMFRQHEIDLPGLTLPSDADFERIGVSLGARRKIQSALASAIWPPLGGPKAERRHLPVLFCDMVGSTEYADRLDPEDFRRLVETFLHKCTEVVQRQRGLVASYIGDAVKSYFGYPVAEEDDAERTVLAGLENTRGGRLGSRHGAASSCAPALVSPAERSLSAALRPLLASRPPRSGMLRIWPRAFRRSPRQTRSFPTRRPIMRPMARSSSPTSADIA